MPRTKAPYLLPDGSVQIVAATNVAGITRALNALYSQQHPGVRFTTREGDNYTAMALLTFDKSAVGPMGSAYTKIGLGDNLKIAAEPMGFKVAHATLKPGPGVPALGIIVNPANPVAALSLGQLTRIFYTGGPSGDIATWGQAGVKGDFATRAIDPVGPLASDYLDSDDPQAGEFLSVDKFGGLNPAHTYTPYAHYADVVKRVAEDPSAIGIVALNVPLNGVKVLPIKATENSPALTADQPGRYALDRTVYFYVRMGKGQPADPFALDYMRTVLSDEGQKAIAAEAAGYVPLTPGELAIERAKLDR